MIERKTITKERAYGAISEKELVFRKTRFLGDKINWSL